MITSNVFDEIHNGISVKMCYLPLKIHTICETEISFTDFKEAVESEIESINVSLYDQGTPLQILVCNPDLASYDKFSLLVQHGADITVDNPDCQDLFSCICDQEFQLRDLVTKSRDCELCSQLTRFHENYIPILDFLLKNNVYTEEPVYIHNGSDNVVQQFPILELLKHKEYIPILKKHLGKFHTEQVKNILCSSD